ncbi:lysostaphin resistance A-like protein [Plantactinospora siamensis]|uniref:Lysostaphin resistance A-like protein n=1 Tax=Plantactinospora siamensis TaxID=555372 RepID=A0ABV6P4D9_9ACTN
MASTSESAPTGDGGLFREPSGRPRKGWRLACYLVLVLGATGVAAALAGDRLPANLLAHAVIAVTAVGLAYLFRRFVDRRPWADIGLSRWRPRDALVGFGAGTASLAAVFVAARALGWVRVTGTELGERAPAAVLALLAAGHFMYAASAVMQEVAFRGYALQTLAEGWPLRRAAVVSSLIFVLPHFSGVPAAPLLAPILTADLMLMAGFFVLTRLGTGSLWLAVGFHTAWNWTMDTVLSMDTDAATDYGNALIHVRDQAPALGLGPGQATEWLYLANSAVLFTGAWLVVRRRRAPHGPARPSADGPASHGAAPHSNSPDGPGPHGSAWVGAGSDR